jgi:hypothetical protein
VRRRVGAVLGVVRALLERPLMPFKRISRAVAIAASVIATAAVAGCSSSPAPGTQNDAATDGPSSCPATVAQRCAQGDPPSGQFGVHCALTLAAAEHDPAICMTPTVSEATCGTLTVITVTNVDFSYLYYYDATGALIAITSNGLVGAQQCVAGPGTFAIPHAACTDRRAVPACAAGDAGADG